jgi:hypothetical protein
MRCGYDVFYHHGIMPCIPLKVNRCFGEISSVSKNKPSKTPAGSKYVLHAV